MTKVFYEDGGISVTDTAFVNAEGNQYPIRNITSIEIKDNIVSPAGMMIIGAILVAVALIIVSASDVGVVSGITGTLGVLILLAAKKAALNSSKVELLIGGGGNPQTGMSLPFSDPNSRPTLVKISNAISESIANLQKT